MVIGGGPAGSFFAIRTLRRARRLGRSVDVLILERRRELGCRHLGAQAVARASCNYCAGGISPRLNDVLERMGLPVPKEIIQNRVRSITLQSHWKNIEIPVPEGRKMFSVYRGSRPKARVDRHLNFDSFLLDEAAGEGAEVRFGEVVGLDTSKARRPVVRFRRDGREDAGTETVEGDFVVFAGGVNQTPGMELRRSKLVTDLRKLMPGFVPPVVRRTLIFELELGRDLGRRLEGRLIFILYGSSDLELEMGSLAPKGEFATVALIGGDVDRTKRARESTELVEAFLALPQVRRLLPGDVNLNKAACVCRPNMVVGGAKEAFGHRVAVVGDMVTARLYKDGIYSAYLTSSALADAILEVGIDAASLRMAYWPMARKLNADNRMGRAVFLCNSIAFRQPALSRITYQAILTERKHARRGSRSLENILWRIASGDDAYRRILGSMFRPGTLHRLIAGGLLITLRNLLTEVLFGLSWRGLGRYPTGVYVEDAEAKIRELGQILDLEVPERRDFRRMYSIRIRAAQSMILRELGRFGDRDREYFRPRFVDVRRVAGAANQVGSVLQYDVVPRFLSFGIVLERMVLGRCLVYRVRDGFAKDGLLVFDVADRGAEDCLLSIVVAFDFRREGGAAKRFFWGVLKQVFPKFIHDVLWNHSLCRFKDIVENR